MLSAEKTKRAERSTRPTCYECGEPILDGEEHTAMQVYDFPWGPPKEIAVHAENADNYSDTCESRLADTDWADFRYFKCDCCGRRVCRQNPKNGWIIQVRIYGGREICLKCFREVQIREGASRDSFEEGRIEGLYYGNGDLPAHGFKLVEGFYGYHLKDDEAFKSYCVKAIGLIDGGYVIVNEYDLMAAGGQEGYVTMWARRNGEGMLS